MYGEVGPDIALYRKHHPFARGIQKGLTEILDDLSLFPWRDSRAAGSPCGHMVVCLQHIQGDDQNTAVIHAGGIALR